MLLETDLLQMEILNSAGLPEALAMLDQKSNTRAILSKDDQNYIQAGAYSNGFIVERRSGNEESHMHARPYGREPLASSPKAKEAWWKRLLMPAGDLGPHKYAFTREEMVALFVAYFDEAPNPDFVTWHNGYS